MPETYDLIVHSHLRWDGVFQRPHQIMSRLSRQHRVVFIEEPLFLDSETADGGYPPQVGGQTVDGSLVRPAPTTVFPPTCGGYPPSAVSGVRLEARQAWAAEGRGRTPGAQRVPGRSPEAARSPICRRRPGISPWGGDLTRCVRGRGRTSSIKGVGQRRNYEGSQ